MRLNLKVPSCFEKSLYAVITVSSRAGVYKKFSVLSSFDHEISPADKYQNTNNFYFFVLLNRAKHGKFNDLMA